MKKIGLLTLVCFLVFSLNLFAQELEYHKVYKMTEGMSADEIMHIKYHNKYTVFANDYESVGYVYFVEKNGTTRQRSFLRRRILLGDKDTGLAYKDLVLFTGPTLVKGMGILTWSYLDPKQEQDQWLWLPSLKKIRKISQAQSDDSFMGSDFSSEEITTRRFEDETYKLLREDTFKGFTSEFNNKTYKTGSDCYVIEARPKRSPWYYSKRIVWIDKKTGGDIYHEIYDSKGRMFKYIFKNYVIMKVAGKDYSAQDFLEVKDLRSGHKTEIVFTNIKYDQALEESGFTTKVLERSKW